MKISRKDLRRIIESIMIEDGSAGRSEFKNELIAGATLSAGVSMGVVAPVAVSLGGTAAATAGAAVLTAGATPVIIVLATLASVNTAVNKGFEAFAEIGERERQQTSEFLKRVIMNAVVTYMKRKKSSGDMTQEEGKEFYQNYLSRDPDIAIQSTIFSKEDLSKAYNVTKANTGEQSKKFVDFDFIDSQIQMLRDKINEEWVEKQYPKDTTSEESSSGDQATNTATTSTQRSTSLSNKISKVQELIGMRPTGEWDTDVNTKLGAFVVAESLNDKKVKTTPDNLAWWKDWKNSAPKIKKITVGSRNMTFGSGGNPPLKGTIDSLIKVLEFIKESRESMNENLSRGSLIRKRYWGRY